MTKQRTLYGSIEIGGTKINCAVAETIQNSKTCLLYTSDAADE